MPPKKSKLPDNELLQRITKPNEQECGHSHQKPLAILLLADKDNVDIAVSWDTTKGKLADAMMPALLQILTSGGLNSLLVRAIELYSERSGQQFTGARILNGWAVLAGEAQFDQVCVLPHQALFRGGNQDEDDD